MGSTFSFLVRYFKNFSSNIKNRLLSFFIIILSAGVVSAGDLRVMKVGLGSSLGTVTSSTLDINCGADCDESYPGGGSVTLNAAAAGGASFIEWQGDCSGAGSCLLDLTDHKSVRALFDTTSSIPLLGGFTAADVDTYLATNPQVDSVPKFIAALPDEYKENWLLMTRSESLQTGTAEMPRILMLSDNAQFVFSLGLSTHSSYPGAHPDAIEYMQWDAVDKNFLFHEIVINDIPAMDPDADGVGEIPFRPRGVLDNEERCSRCHSTRNIVNKSGTTGTDGLTPGTVKVKNKPNWDPYDSWGGLMPFNRDRVFEGSIDAAAFRKTLNLWTWREDDFSRAIIEQLFLQPQALSGGSSDQITRTEGGQYDGYINFDFDDSSPILSEPDPSTLSLSTITTNYNFDNTASGLDTTVYRNGSSTLLHHTNGTGSDEGRGVQLFDILGGLDGTLNAERIADEIKNHHTATGNFPIDVNPLALAITRDCFTVSGSTINATAGMSIDYSFFDARNGMGIGDLVDDTDARVKSIPRRKADIQKINLDRAGDIYTVSPVDGVIAEFGALTDLGTDTSFERIRKEVFRRSQSVGGGSGDQTIMGGIYVDREDYSYNIDRVALYRYFLEPLGVSVDKWSTGVRGRSRAYGFADVFDNAYIPTFREVLADSLGVSEFVSCTDLVPLVNASVATLPAADAVPNFTDIQRVFNKSCIECHGGLDYPPYQNYGSFFDVSEDDAPLPGDDKLDRSHGVVTSFGVTTDPASSFIYQLITDPDEDCPLPGMMPCGGPPLSKSDIETVRRWIVGSSPNTRGDPHIRTVDGTNYDFQAAGEFVLLEDAGFELQARHSAVETSAPLGPNSHTGLTSCVSINSAVAMKVGSHRITYQPDISGEPNPQGLQLRVDGELVSLNQCQYIGDEKASLKLNGALSCGYYLPQGGRIIPTDEEHGIQVEAPGGTSVVITPRWWGSQQMWFMNIDVRNARATQGLMGIIQTGNWLPALPNGGLLGARPGDLQQRYNDLYLTFGNAWRVSDSTSLFDYSAGRSSSDYTIASWPLGESPDACVIPENDGGGSGVPATGMLIAEAEALCNDVLDPTNKLNCIQDTSITGEPGFAEIYLASERFEVNDKPAAPELNFPEAFSKDIPQSLDFSWQTTTDAEGEGLTYWLCVWPNTERQTYSHCKVIAKTDALDSGAQSQGFLIWILIFIIVISIGLLIHSLLKKRHIFAFILVLLILGLMYLLLSAAASNLSTQGPQTLSSEPRSLRSGQIYFWKVIVEDEQGGTSESETRRFTVEE